MLQTPPRDFFVRCVFSPPHPVCGLQGCGSAALRCAAGMELILLAWDQLIVRSSHTALPALPLLLTPSFHRHHLSSERLYGSFTLSDLIPLSLPTHLAIWNFLKFFICNPGSRCLTAALYFFRTMVCVSLILAEVVNVVSDCQEIQIFSKPQDSSNTNTMEFSLFWVWCERCESDVFPLVATLN